MFLSSFIILLFMNQSRPHSIHLSIVHHDRMMAHKERTVTLCNQLVATLHFQVMIWYSRIYSNCINIDILHLVFPNQLFLYNKVLSIFTLFVCQHLFYFCLLFAWLFWISLMSWKPNWYTRASLPFLLLLFRPTLSLKRQ